MTFSTKTDLKTRTGYFLFFIVCRDSSMLSGSSLTNESQDIKVLSLVNIHYRNCPREVLCHRYLFYHFVGAKS